MNYHPLTAEALARVPGDVRGGRGVLGGWGRGPRRGFQHRLEQAERRAREARARGAGRLARLAAERMEWEVRSRQMEKALMQKTGDGAGDAALPENLFADFRKALARALLLTSEVVERDDAAADDDPTEDGSTSMTSQTLSDTDSEELANQLVSELPRRVAGGWGSSPGVKNGRRLERERLERERRRNGGRQGERRRRRERRRGNGAGAARAPHAGASPARRV